MGATSLTWDQVNTWRLTQHGLAPRLAEGQLVEAVSCSGGIQAQVMSAAELAIGARADGVTPQAVQSALWRERTLVKTWAMRGTLHLLAAGDLPAYVAARSVHGIHAWADYFEYYGVPPEHYQAFLAAVPEVLGDAPITREQLADMLAERIGSPALRELVVSKGWGTPLKPLAWRGDLCFGPNQGRNVTFVRPSAWLGAWRAVEPHEAVREQVRRYLRAYGPATPADFARWWEGGSGITAAKRLFRSMSEELVEVDVEGWGAYALRATIEPMQGAAAVGTVRLLPLFDTYVLGLGRQIEPLLPAAFRPQVFRPQGWISAVVLADGYIRGVWEYANRGAATTVRVRMFAKASARVERGIADEAERLGAFLGTRIAAVEVQ